MHIKCDIYIFIFSLRILIYQCHIWMSTKEIIAYMKSFPNFIMFNDERSHFHPIWLYYNPRCITLNIGDWRFPIPSINPQIWIWPVRPHVVDGYLSEWVSDCCFNVNSTIFQLYHGEKLIFNEMMTRSAMYYTNTLSWFFLYC